MGDSHLSCEGKELPSRDGQTPVNIPILVVVATEWLQSWSCLGGCCFHSNPALDGAQQSPTHQETSAPSHSLTFIKELLRAMRVHKGARFACKN